MSATRKTKRPESGERGAVHRGAAGHWDVRAARLRGTLVAGGIFLITLGVFLRAVGNDFVDYDDLSALVRNPAYRGLGVPELRWMFTTFFWGHYQPLFWVSFALDYLWTKALLGNGVHAGGYHFTSILLHAINAALVYLLIRRLLELATTGVQLAERTAAWRRELAAALGALFFALHPLRAEPATWLTGRGDLVAAVFLLPATLAYLRAAQAANGRNYARWLTIALVCYALSLLGRAMGVALPFVLVVLDWYPLHRLGPGRGGWFGRAARRVWLEKVPFLALALGAAILAPLAKAEGGSTVELATHGVLARLVQCCYGLVFYIWKTLLPTGLSPIYELHPPINLLAPRYVVAVGIVISAAVLLFRLRRRWPAVFAGLLSYALLVSPVLGLGQSGRQEVADRYSYTPAVALATLAAAGFVALVRRAAASAERLRRTPAPIVPARWACAGVVILLAEAALTFRQIGVWQSTATLWTHAVALQPDSATAQNGRGFVLTQTGQLSEAEPHLRRAVAIDPKHAEAYYNLWNVLRQQGRDDELVSSIRDAIRAMPDLADAHYSLGLALQNRRDYDEALAAYTEAVRLRPAFSQAQTNLGSILWMRGRSAEALAHYEAAVQADSQNLVARRSVVRLLREQGRIDEARAQVEAALRIDPNEPHAQKLLAELNAERGTP